MKDPKPPTFRVKNWDQFQHFKDRRPPWIKLYRHILDDRAWHLLDPSTAKVLIGLWLLASEDSDQAGNLPDIATISFRLRMEESETTQHLTTLCTDFLECSDINAISTRYQDDRPEKRQRQRREDTCPSVPAGRVNGKHDPREEGFAEWYAGYPRKEAKADALKAWRGLTTADKAAAQAALPTFAFSPDKQFQPLPATWIRRRRWEDETSPADTARPGYQPGVGHYR